MILIVDDDAAIRASLSLLLKRAGYTYEAVSSPDEAMTVVRKVQPEAVLLDMNFSCATSGIEGLTLLRQILLFAPATKIILMTAWGSIELAVEGMRAGAFHFITKLWDNRQLLERLSNAVKIDKTNDITVDRFDRAGIIGESHVLKSALDIVRRVAPTSAPVLINGESGTGKELIAEAIHRNSSRRDKPFVKVNLGGLPASLFESEMFGHVKGAFTGALNDRIGRFESADGGTIFLDEIGELDLSCQVKLLRVLQEQTFEPLGSNKTRKIDVRIICATNVNLREMVAERRFREDLYYRISVVGIELPPLRERGRDIILLAEQFLTESCRRNKLNDMRISEPAKEYLCTRPFPGNIRELKNLVERTALLSPSDTIKADDFKAAMSDDSSLSMAAPRTLDEIEADRISAVLEKHRGNISRAARELGLSRAALYRRMEKFDIKS